MANVKDPIKCADKSGSVMQQAHKWIYLGWSVQTYRCELCGDTITKRELKEKTDNA